jgi:hypothetical protein
VSGQAQPEKENATMSEFLITGPPWIVIDRRHLPDPAARDIDIDQGVLISTCAVEGENAVAIFTDQDLAERHARDRGPDWIPIRPKSPLALANLLRIMQSGGFSKIVVDAGPGQPTNLASLGEVIAAYEKLR